MRVKLTTRPGDAFHAGWLAQLCGVPFDEAQPFAWRDAWKMAEETGEVAWLAVPAALRLGQLIVETEADEDP